MSFFPDSQAKVLSSAFKTYPPSTKTETSAWTVTSEDDCVWDVFDCVHPPPRIRREKLSKRKEKNDLDIEKKERQ